uniref:Uncharacterized protein n=1 Tax=Glossina austeni TaxID=7395 RepID=A0A1A9UK34_GLOAU
MSNKRLSLMLSELFEMGFKTVSESVISSSKLFPGTIYLTGICEVSFAENRLVLEIAFALSAEIFSIHFAEIVGGVFLRFSVVSLLQLSWLKVSTMSLPARVSFVTNDLGGDFLVDYSELQCRQREPVQYRNVL